MPPPRRPQTPEEALQRAQRLVQRYAATSPYDLAGDAVVLRTIVSGIARNWLAHGLPYCPCKELSGDPTRDRLLVCPCRDHHEEIRRTGACCCGLYIQRSDE